MAMPPPAVDRIALEVHPTLGRNHGFCTVPYVNCVSATGVGKYLGTP